jgi:hypothetical protein
MTTMEELHKLKGEDLVKKIMNIEWFALPNDLIGGWCVMPINEQPSGGCVEVADFIDGTFAVHIAQLHNEWLKRNG